MSELKKIFFLAICCIMISGCAISPLGKVSDLNKTIQMQDEEIKSLKKALAEKEEALAQKEQKIKELRNKLNNFGVFE